MIGSDLDHGERAINKQAHMASALLGNFEEICELRYRQPKVYFAMEIDLEPPKRPRTDSERVVRASPI